MTKYILTRLGASFVMLLGVLVLVFFMLRLTGDPTSLLVAREATAEQRQAAREAYGLDRPVYEQFADFATDAAVLDFGNSLRYKIAVRTVIANRIPATVELATVAMIMAMVVGIPLGVLAGTKTGSGWDKGARGLGLTGQTIPSFLLALVLVVVGGVWLGWFPTFGRETFNIGPLKLPDKSVIMPAFALSLFPMAQLLRFTRSSVLEITGEDYVRIARSKGIPERLIYTRHILRNALIPLISITSLQVGALLGGSVYVEEVFSWPGVGSLFVEAIGNRDFQLVQGVAFFLAAVVIAIQLTTDILYTVADPRIRVAGSQ